MECPKYATVASIVYFSERILIFFLFHLTSYILYRFQNILIDLKIILQNINIYEMCIIVTVITFIF